jgi:hypothetical protein
MKLAILTAVVLAASALSSCGQSDAKPKTHHDVTALAAQAKGEVIVIGTLATLGSFEWTASPLKTHAAAGLKHIPQLLHDHKLTKEQAQAKLDQIDAAHDLIEQALKVCKQNDHTGKCAGDTVKAQALLDQARNDLAIADQGLN